MTSQDAFSFRLDPGSSPLSRHLVYEEPGFALVVYLEMSGVSKFDWVGCDTEFREWTTPEKLVISAEKQNQILGRLQDWSSANKIRIGIGSPIDRNAFLAEQEARGYKIERMPDGSILMTPPKRMGLYRRLARLFK